MPKEQISIPIKNYPELKDISEGDDVKLTVDAKVLSNDGETLEIETRSIESELDNAAQFQKDMSRNPINNYGQGQQDDNSDQ